MSVNKHTDQSTEIEVLQYLNLTQDTIWNAARDRQMNRPLTPAEGRKIQEGQPKEVVARERFWRLRPDGITVLPPVGNKTGVLQRDAEKRTLLGEPITENSPHGGLSGFLY